METNVTLERAWHLLQGLVANQKRIPHQLPLLEAVGHVLAADYVAISNFPPFKRSRMDGFAVNSQVTAAKKGILPIQGIVPAGSVSEIQLGPEAAVEIMTGAPLPAGTDAVVKKEECQVQDNCLQLLHLPSVGEHVNQAGEEFSIGQRLVAAGTRLTGHEISLLAMDGATEVTVVSAPSIGLLSTGTELQPLGEELLPGHIYNSNFYGIAAELKRLGYEVANLGVSSDSLTEITRALTEAVAKHALIITTGGVAGSKYDLLAAALETMGGQVSFWKLDIKPGTPVLVGTCQGSIIVALSGNPPAAFFGFNLICRPLIAWLEGEDYTVPTMEATLREDVGHHGKGSSRQLYKGDLSYEAGRVYVTPVSSTQAGLLRYLSSSSCYIVAEPGVEMEVGQLVRVLVVG